MERLPKKLDDETREPAIVFSLNEMEEFTLKDRGAATLRFRKQSDLREGDLIRVDGEEGGLYTVRVDSIKPSEVEAAGNHATPDVDVVVSLEKRATP
ncbi:MAG: hypothetical protein HYS26_04255 [Candidatus Kaiserbacteria bacterium]|nr:MAG: hypothetical protein HYS26_04255 [Candidatus Kaiserbacteria bacterium]